MTEKKPHLTYEDSQILARICREYGETILIQFAANMISQTSGADLDFVVATRQKLNAIAREVKTESARRRAAIAEASGLFGDATA